MSELLTPNLAKALVEKGVIRQHTEIDAYYQGIDIGGAALARVLGNFTIVGAKATKDTVLFEARNTSDGTRRVVDCQDILTIDGMEAARFAGIYGLSDEGDTVKQGARRGRKPKSAKEEEEAA